MTLGVLFALSERDRIELLNLGDETERRYFVSEVLEQRWEEDWLCELAKAWDAIHRCLGDGELVEGSDGDGHLVILGGHPLHTGDDYIISFKTPEQVARAAAFLRTVTHEILAEKYWDLRNTSYTQFVDESDLEHTLGWFERLPSFYDKAESATRSVIFTASQ
jgi:hypothetical protein